MFCIVLGSRIIRNSSFRLSLKSIEKDTQQKPLASYIIIVHIRGDGEYARSCACAHGLVPAILPQLTATPRPSPVRDSGESGNSRSISLLATIATHTSCITLNILLFR